MNAYIINEKSMFLLKNVYKSETEQPNQSDNEE